MEVFITGCDGAVYQNWYADGSWHGWASLGGYASSAPAAAWRRGPPNYFDIAIKGGDNAIWFQIVGAGNVAGAAGRRSAAT